MANTFNVYSKITELRKRYYNAISGKESLVGLILESEVAEQVYNSNAIENSTLSFEETEKILLQVDLDRFISQRELFEAKNLARVVGYIQTKAKQQELELETILSLHKMLMSNIRDEVAGRFRNNQEWVKVGSQIALDPKQVKPAVDQMLTEYKANSDQDIVKRIAKFHLTFENIHPFVDGNGRIGRVLNNYLLIREGFVPINIKFIERERYYDAFNEFDRQGKTEIMQEIVAKALTNSYHKRLAYLESKKIIGLKEYAKLANTTHSNVLNKASRQTIEAFLEKGIWKMATPQI
ncbi:MAG: Fic family protein [bacterium]